MNFEENLISVIIPVYNVAKYLPQCLDSIILNTYTNLEIICVNDGSTDDSVKICLDYAEKDSRIVIINKQNGGAASARNEGLRYAKGEYIAFIDSDDWIHPYYFEHLHKASIEYNADIVICDFVRSSIINVLKDDITYSARPMSLEEMMSSRRYKSYVWRKLFRHDFIYKKFFNESIQIEDVPYNYEILIQNKIPQIAYLDEILYAYFVRDGSLITKLDERAMLEVTQFLFYDLYKVKEIRIRKLFCSEIVKRALSARYSFLILGENQNVQECNKIIKTCFGNYYDTKLWILYKFPYLYRLWMILHDKSMLVYERNLKAKKRNNPN